MIRSENAPSLCPRCVHFKKNHDVGCKIGNYGILGPIAESIQKWLRDQECESSWTYMGACPEFKFNGSSAEHMSTDDRRALKQILGIL